MATWDQYRGNAQKQGHSGSVEEILGPSGNESIQLWSRSGPTFAGFVSSPVITSKGIAIVGDLDARVYAVQVSTGELLWSTAQALGEYLSSSPSLSADEERVYMSAFVMSTNSAVFYEIGAANGTILSSTTIPCPVSSTSAFSSFAMYRMEQPPAILAITAFGDKILALHTTDYYDNTQGDHFHPGYQMWNYSDAFNSSYAGAAGSDLNIQSTPAVDGDYAYFATPAGEVIALDCRDGVEQWRVYTGGYLGSSPVVDPETQRLYITGTRGMHALTLEEGISPDDRLLVSFATQTTISSAALTVDGSTLYFATSAGTLYAIDLDATFAPLLVPRRRRGKPSGGASVSRRLLTTEVKWQTALGSAVQLSSPVVDSQGNVYIGTAGGTICAVNATGYLLWSRQTSGSAVYGSASLAGNHTLVIGTQDGLYAFYAAPPAAPAAAPLPPTGAGGKTDFPESAIWVLVGVLISMCFVTTVYLCYGYQRERKKHQAKLQSERESVTLAEVHRVNGGAVAGAGSRGLRSVFSSETSSDSSNATTVRLSTGADSKRSGWGSSIGAGFWMDRNRTPGGGRGGLAREDESIDHPPGETTGKWHAPGSRPTRVRSVSSLTMSRDTSQLPPSSKQHHRERVARYAGGGGGQAATLANAVEASEDRRPSTDSEGSGTTSSVRGLFALLGLRKQSKEEPSRAQETPSVSASQEIVEIRVISPTPSPTRTSRAASLLWRDSADGTAMFSRKASGSVATGGLTADESKHDVGAAGGVPRSRGGTEASLPSHSEMRAHSGPLFAEEAAALDSDAAQPQPPQRPPRAGKMAPKRRKRAEWDGTPQSDSQSDCTVQSSPFHKAAAGARGGGPPPVANPSQQGMPPPSTYRYQGSSSAEGGMAATEVDPSAYYISSDSGTRYSYSVDPRASAPGEGDSGVGHKEGGASGSDSGAGSPSGEESPYWTNKPIPADSQEFRKTSLLAAAAAAGGHRALSSVHSGATGSSAEQEEVQDDVLTASVTVRESSAGAEAPPVDMATSYAESFVPSLDGVDGIPMTPTSDAPSAAEMSRQARKPLVEEEQQQQQQQQQELFSRGLRPLDSPAGSAAAGGGPPLRSPTKLGKAKVLSLRMPDKSLNSSSWSTFHDLSATVTSLPSEAPPPPPTEMSSGEEEQEEGEEGEGEADDDTAYYG